MFRWGVLSTAKIARDVVIPAHLNSASGNVSAIASRSMRKANATASRFGIPNAFGSYEEMLESDVIDGVYIPLPTSQHVEWSLKAAKAGKHVLCEKPLAVNADEARRMAESARKNKRFLMEAMWTRFLPAMVQVASG